MKLTDDIVKALQKCIEDGFVSVSDFAKFANVSADTVSRYLRKETESIRDDTWKQLQPLLKPYMRKKVKTTHGKGLELTTDQKILLDAFRDLSEDVQRQKLMEIIELAKRANRKKEHSGNE